MGEPRDILCELIRKRYRDISRTHCITATPQVQNNPKRKGWILIHDQELVICQQNLVYQTWLKYMSKYLYYAYATFSIIDTVV